MRDEVRKFYADPKNKGLRVDEGKLKQAESFEISEATTRQGTKELLKQLNEQKSIYDQYNAYVEQNGIKAAQKMFGEQSDLAKDYRSNLEKEYFAISTLQKTAALAPFTGVGVKLTQAQEERAKELKQMLDALDKEDAVRERAKYAGALQLAKTHVQKLEDIEKEHQQHVTALGKDATAEELENLKKARDEKIKSQNEEFFLKSDLYKKASKEALIRTRAELKEQIKLVEDLLKTDLAPNIKERLNQELSDLKINLSVGSVKTNISNLETQRTDVANAISQYNIDNGIKEITDQALESHPELKKLYDLLKQITGQISKLKKEANDGPDGGFLGFLKKLEGNETLKEISEWGGVAAQSFSQMSQALGGTDTQAGYLLGTIGDLAGAAADVAGAIASGDPKAIVKSAIGAISTVFSISKKTKEMNRQAREENQKFYDEAKKGEKEYQALLRQRELDTVARGKNSYNAIIAQLEAVKKQSPEVQKAYDKIFSSLQGQDYINGKGYEHGTWFRKAKTWDIMASLRGADYDKLEKLYSEGKLKDKAKEDFESLKALREELEEAGLSVEDLQKSLDELLTGTSSSGLASGLADLFENGKRYAQDFADSFESILGNAIKSSFQAKYLEDAMQPFYNELADLMEGGNLTEKQIQALKEKYILLGEEYAKKWEDIEKIIGTGSSSDSSSTIKGKLDRELSEKTGGEIVGIFRAGYDVWKQQLVAIQAQSATNVNILAIANEKLIALNAIQVNTANTVQRLDVAVKHLDTIVKNTSKTGRSAEGMGL